MRGWLNIRTMRWRWRTWGWPAGERETPRKEFDCWSEPWPSIPVWLRRGFAWPGCWQPPEIRIGRHSCCKMACVSTHTTRHFRLNWHVHMLRAETGGVPRPPGRR